MTHPAIALIRAGQVIDAVAYLRARGDHPSGLALLEHGFVKEAVTVLVGMPPTGSAAK